MEMRRSFRLCSLDFASDWCNMDDMSRSVIALVFSFLLVLGGLSATDLPLREILEPARFAAPEEQNDAEEDESASASEEEEADASAATRTARSAAPNRPYVPLNPTPPALVVGPTEPRGDVASVYVIPIDGAIDRTNFFILRRALKEAIRNDIEMVIIDMNTPGGRVDFTLEMMEMLDRFEGVTATYVNNDAISAGSFIAAATDEIYFAPRGRIGASAVVMGGGQDVPETARLKIESYLLANIRSLSEDFRYRGDVIRAMMDANFELVIDGDVVKPAGELLTLTARESMQLFGDPALPLLGSGMYESIDQLLDARWGEGRYEIRAFELTYSEEVAKWMAPLASGLIGIGLLLLFIEFKTPGFGIFGILGLVFIGIFFISNYIAGLAGNEAVVFFVIGILFILVELLFLPGTLVFALLGGILVIGSMLWAMVDYWPGGTFEFTWEVFTLPVYNLTLGIGLATFGAILLAKLLPHSVLFNRMVLATDLGHGDGLHKDEIPDANTIVGASGIVVRDCFPTGEVEIGGQRYSAVVEAGSLPRGSRIRVVGKRTYDLIVEEDTE
jgi:membrane-bound serine protease (ClpP class)